MKLLCSAKSLLLISLITTVSCSTTEKTRRPVVVENHSGISPDSAGTENYYIVEEKHPKMIGGMQRLQDKVRYPKEAKKQNIEGIVRLGFMVQKDGKIGDITVVQSPHPMLSRAAKRALKKMKFIPGKQDGEPVDVYMTLPVLFRL